MNNQNNEINTGNKQSSLDLALEQTVSRFTRDTLWGEVYPVIKPEFDSNIVQALRVGLQLGTHRRKQIFEIIEHKIKSEIWKVVPANIQKSHLRACDEEEPNAICFYTHICNIKNRLLRSLLFQIIEGTDSDQNIDALNMNSLLPNNSEGNMEVFPAINLENIDSIKKEL